MKLVTAKEHEVFGRMEDLLLSRDYRCVASDDDTSSYRKRGALIYVTLRKVTGIHDPVVATVTVEAYNSKGLAIVLDEVGAA